MEEEKRNVDQIFLAEDIGDSDLLFLRETLGSCIVDSGCTKTVCGEEWLSAYVESLSEHSKDLPPLRHGDKVFVQNQNGHHPTKWDRTGEIMECRPHNQYTVKIDASGRITLRNRQYLRKYTPSPRDVLRGVPPPSIEVDHHTENSTNDPPTRSGDTNDSTTSEPCDPPTTIHLEPTTTHPERISVEEPPQSTSPDIPHLRRSERVRHPTRVYDSSLGKYVLPTT